MMHGDGAPDRRAFWSFALLGGVERFAWYVVRSLLLLFLVTASVPSSEWPANPLIYGAGWSQAAASQTLLWLTTAAAVVPLLGGVLIDRLLGRERAPALGLALLSAGLAVLVLTALLASAARESTLQLLLAGGLGLLLLGSALLRPAVLLGMAGALADRPYALMGGYVAYSQLIINLFAMLAPLLSGVVYMHAGFAWGLASGLLLMPLAFWLLRHCCWPPAPLTDALSTGQSLSAPGPATGVRASAGARPLLWLAAVLTAVAVFADWTQQRVDQALTIRPLFGAIGIDNNTVYGLFDTLLVLVAGVVFSVWWLRRRSTPDWRRQALIGVLLIAGMAATLGGVIHALHTAAIPVLLITLALLFVAELLLEALLFMLLARLRHTRFAATVFGLFLALPTTMSLLIARHPDAIWPASLLTGGVCLALLLLLLARPPRFFLQPAN